MRFHMNVGNIDGITRGLGGVPLVIGAILALPGVSFHTLETLSLWLALLVGLTALGAAFAGHCSWFAGVVISATVWILFVLRNVPVVPIEVAASALGVIVGLYAIYTHRTKKCAVNFVLNVTMPHHEASSLPRL